MSMSTNTDFNERVVVHSDTLEWQPSPIEGVERRPLDRIGDEVARATTIVRYAPGSAFTPHVHTGGEEFIVLDGVFQDEHGDFPAGSYIRNPPQSSHTPASADGCIIFVKLWQFDPDDRTHVRLHMDKMLPVPADERPGVSVTPLYADDREVVRMEHWESGAEVVIDESGGTEALVLGGSFEEGGDHLVQNSWLRLPEGRALTAKAGPDGTKVWIKTGHLRFVEPPGVS